MAQFVWSLLKFIVYEMAVFLLALYLMYFDQKIITFIQRRQVKSNLHLRTIVFPIALFVNLFKTKLVIPTTPYKFLYVLLPIFFAILVFVLGMFIPFHKRGFFWGSDYGALWVIVISNALIYLMMLIGWASQSQYSLQGVVRLFSHFISSSLLFFLVLMIIILWTGSMNFQHIIYDQKSMWFIFPLLPVFLVNMAVLLMRGRCAPFGSSESGIDLMGGYKSRYTGGLAVLLIISEYLHFLLLSSLTIVLFFGGWLPAWESSYISGFAWFFIKLLIFLGITAWVRAILPNLRPDQLVRLHFKALIPLSVCLLITYGFIKIILGK